MCDKKEKQLELDKRYLRMAAVWAENSYCKRRQVGALIVRDQMIISDGYNGTPSGFESGRFVQQQQRRNDLRHLRSLHRMCQTHHPIWDQAGGIL